MPTTPIWRRLRYKTGTRLVTAGYIPPPIAPPPPSMSGGIAVGITPGMGFTEGHLIGMTNGMAMDVDPSTFAYDASGLASSTMASHLAASDPHTQYLKTATASTIYAPISHTQAFSTITGTPTTINGYGITDAVPAANPSFTGNVGVPTRTAGDSSANAASTAFVANAVALANLIYTNAISTDATGSFTVTYPTGKFSAAPVVTCVVLATGGRAHVVTLLTSTSTGCTGKVRRLRVLPASILTLIALNGYDVCEDPGVITVYLEAQPVKLT